MLDLRTFAGRLTDRVSIVTGAGSREDDGELIGTGAAIARLFAAAGARVAVLDRDEPAARRTAASIASEGGGSVAVVADVALQADVERSVAQVEAMLGPVDILVNNAAVTSPVALDRLTRERWDEVVDINLTGSAMMIRACLPSLSRAKSGAIVNIASVAALRGFASPAYAAAKGGMIALTTDLSASLGPSGVRVNAVIPGHVYTPMVRRGDPSEQGRELRKRVNPLRTEGTGWDVALATLFLAGAEARWITGVALPVDAGLLATAPLSAAMIGTTYA